MRQRPDLDQELDNITLHDINTLKGLKYGHYWCPQIIFMTRKIGIYKALFCGSLILHKYRQIHLPFDIK